MLKSKRICSMLLVVVMLATFVVFPGGVSEVNATVNPTIIVDTSDRETDATLSKLGIGTNHRYAYNAFESYDNVNKEVYDVLKTDMQDAKIAGLRYPGGTLANTFQWKYSIGQERHRTIHGGNLSMLDSNYGVDEHFKFAESIEAESIYVIGITVQTPQDAADLVEYLNAPNNGSNPGGGTDWAAVRASNGHGNPYNVKYFELGNEMNLVNQHYWMGWPSASGLNKSLKQKYFQGDTVRATRDDVCGAYDDWSVKTSNGAANQVFFTKYHPIVAGTQTVYVGGIAWNEVRDITVEGSQNVYQFDAVTGKITFGDGIHGNIPGNGVALTVSYQFYHDGYLSYYNAIKAIDPTIRVFSCFENPWEYVASDQCDGVVQHPYPSYGDLTSGQLMHDSFMSNITNYGTSTPSDIIDQSNRNDTDLCVSEWGTIYSFSPPGVHVLSTLSKGLWVGGVMMENIKKEAPLSLYHCLVDYSLETPPPGTDSLGTVRQALWSTYPNFVPSAAAKAFYIVGNNKGDKSIPTWINDNTTITSIKGNYPGLRVTATKDSVTNDIYLLVLNGNGNNNITANLDFKGYTISGNARVMTMNGANYTTENTIADPQAIDVVTTTTTLGVGGSTFGYTFPAHSITGIKLSGSVSNAWNSLMNDDFTNDIAGQTPSGYTTTGTVTVENDPVAASNKVMRVTRSGGVNASATKTFSTQTGIVRIKARVRADQTTSHLRFRLYNTNNENPFTFNLSTTGKVQARGTTTAYIYESNNWYNIEMLTNINSGKFDLYCEDKKLTDYGFGTDTVHNINRVEISAMNGDGTFYVDDIKIDYLGLSGGLAGYWMLNETSGTTATDSSENSRNGTLINGAAWNTAGKFDGCVNLDGLDDYVSLPSIVNPGTSDFTASGWVKLNQSSGSNSQVILQQEGTNGKTWVYRKSSNGALATYLGGAELAGTGIINTATWYHVAVMKGGSTVKLYLNGNMVGSAERTVASATSNLRLGRHKSPDTSNEEWNGSVDQIRVYNYALSDGEIQSLYASGQ